DLENLDSKTKYSSEGTGADIRNTFSFSNNLFTNNLTVGVDYEKEEGKGTNKTVTDENRGVFAQNRMIFNDFNLSFGARYDDYENDFVQKKFS
ncbi:TonB-dependent receptor domain-containing protein, partial [Aliarcobacter butzleri]